MNIFTTKHNFLSLKQAVRNNINSMDFINLAFISILWSVKNIIFFQTEKNNFSHSFMPGVYL